MGVYLCTIEETNLAQVEAKFGAVETVFRFQPATVLGNCYGGTRQKQNVVVRISDVSRSAVERSSLIARVRAKAPEGGFESLDGPYISAQSCLGVR